MNISMDMIKELKERTGLGIMDCKNALIKSQGDIEKAIDYLRKEGILKAAKKSSRVASEGVIDSYIHYNKKLGVLVEVNCETDFVAKTQDFIDMAHQISIHIGAMEPQFVNENDVPTEIIEKEKEIYREQLKDSKKPENVIKKIIENKLQKFYEDNCLYKQQFFGSEDKKTVEDYIKENIAKFGENIIVRRFSLFKIGE